MSAGPDSAEAQRMRQQMGSAVAGLMDVTDAYLAAALRSAEAAMADLDAALRSRQVATGHRLSILSGVAHSAITRHLAP